MILRLNMRHALPQIGIRNRQSTIDDSHMVPAQIHTNNQQARSNKGITQPRIDIDSYPSRRAYGYRKMGDFTRENGQKGISDVKSADSSHTQAAWDVIDNGAKRGNYIQQREESRIYSEAKRTVNVEMELIPSPQITLAEPSQVVGEPDLGDVTAEIDAKHYASIKITPGSAETYMKDKGFLHRWVTENKYDIYA